MSEQRNKQTSSPSIATVDPVVSAKELTALIRAHADGTGANVVFTLSGRMDAEHIAELESLIGAEGKGRGITLDLKDMTLTGQDGIDFLIRCEASDIALVNCDPYVREWITRQQSGN